MMTSRFYSLVITCEAVYCEGKQIGRLETPDDLPRYTNYLLTPLPESGGVQSFDWIVPSWLTKLRYDLYASEAEREQLMDKYYDTRQQSDGLWYIVGSVDGFNWYYLYEDMLTFPSQAEARAWLIAEGYTNGEDNRMQKPLWYDLK